MATITFTKRDVISFQADERVRSWLDECATLNGARVVDSLVEALFDVGATLNDFWLVYAFSGTDNIQENLDLLAQVRSHIGGPRPLCFSDVADDCGKSKLGH